MVPNEETLTEDAEKVKDVKDKQQDLQPYSKFEARKLKKTQEIWMKSKKQHYQKLTKIFKKKLPTNTRGEKKQPTT